MVLYNVLKKFFCMLVMLFFIPLLMRSIAYQYRTIYEPKTRIGVVYFTSPVTQSIDYYENIHSFFRDHDIQGILLYIPGATGLLGTAQTIAQTIITLKKEYTKPVIAFIENECTSALYLIACAADTIITAGTTLISPLDSHVTDRQSKDGIPDDHDHISDYKKSNYEQINAFISQYRKIPVSFITDHTVSLPLSGVQAKRLGFIDDYGGIHKVYGNFVQKTLGNGTIEWITYNSHVTSWITTLYARLFPSTMSYTSFYSPLQNNSPKRLPMRKDHEKHA